MRSAISTTFSIVIFADFFSAGSAPKLGTTLKEKNMIDKTNLFKLIIL
ncbi:hypothetical protein LEP1GSC185_3439 [Leptospira licerasiae serovar Varillal str. VAR 010]|uniref:Uncharacterized protein n=1 Tax=Leptospira licerasiae str. MMD4847 TaxID=1049971 RepID=A0ABN0HCT7_9LEPT|nr:hypothetical protein LEP1GSC185_3439 [Leptospira licerasiae serovar Varillal str. VAR 010]EJZ43323.1 hypothetical protein LEP1GSC178_3051 [Leptospira licerasiae str. MMD4847]EMK01206.1 hypothetical protein LEP1GSC192_1188 [Leptospira sp. B5-022]